METKIKIGFLAMLCLLGMGFAMDGNGTAVKKEIPLEIRAQWMEAVHTGDYEAAVALHEEYGIGGKRMEFATLEMFQLRGEIFQAMKDGEWLKAVRLQDQFRELVKGKMGELPKPPHGKGMGKHGMRGPPGEMGEPPLGEMPPPEEMPPEMEIAE